MGQRLDGRAAESLIIRPRQDGDEHFILRVTERELVPTLERAWRFSWDAGHARKFMLDLLTIGETRVASLPGGEPIGYAWFRIFNRGSTLWRRRVCWLNYIVLDKTYQNQGFGSRLLFACETEASQLRCTSIELWVQRDNEGAARFYRRHSFKRFGSAGDNVHMGKRVPRSESAPAPQRPR